MAITKKLIFPSVLAAILGVCYLSAPNIGKDYCKVLYAKDGRILHVKITKDDKWRIYAKDIPKTLQDMVISFEDKRFYQHLGVDPIALSRAVWQFLKNRKVISGGSTITMQTVRLLEPRPRTMLSKFIECFKAIGLELRYSKKEILQLYLSLAPYGANIEGIVAASWTYFASNNLTPDQMALLTVLPQHPNLFNPIKHPKEALRARNKVLNRLGFYDYTEEPIPQKIHPMPNDAYHATASTLDYDLQINLQNCLKVFVKDLPPKQTMAAAIISNKTKEIIAYVGSALPFDNAKQGYVDILKSIRSPGSALKPFIYALAFEENLAHPFMIVRDIATNFNGYQPTNFQDIFHGDVTLSQALQRSLNIPAVQLLEKIGPNHFTEWMLEHGAKLYVTLNDVGLPIALGGVGIKFLDLVYLYSDLSRGMLFSRDVTEKITNILQGIPAPGGFVDNIVTGQDSIAFKTGTSYGSRDALCIGYNQDYTVGVWVGRSDGSACENLLGHKNAAPVVFHIFKTILPETLQNNTQNTESRGFKKLPYKQPLRLIAPSPDGTHLLNKRADGSIRKITIKITGGKEPYNCWLNGELLFSNRSVFSWTPRGEGFYNFSIRDAAGNRQQESVEFITTPR